VSRLRPSIPWFRLAPFGSGGSNSFETIVVAGQSNVVADSSTDTITLVAGSNITITTNAATDTITIAASGSTGYATVQEEGVSLAQEATINFIGIGLTAVDDAGNSRTNVTFNENAAFAWTAAHTHTVAGLVSTLTNTTDNASVQVAIFQGDRATMADNDEAYLTLRLSDDGGTQKEVARITWAAPDVNAGTSVDGRLDFSVMTAGTLAKELQLSGADLSPSTSGGLTLGTTSLPFGGVFINSGATINANNDAIITHSAGIFTVSTGDFRVTTAGTNTASVVTVGGTQTLTNKTLTSPAINTATLGGHQTMLENAALLLDPALSADGTYNGIVRGGTAGTTLAFGDLVYLDPTDSRWELADANVAAGADGDSRGVLGICVLAAGADGNATTVLLHGIVRADAAFPAMTVNNPMYVSETAGDITGTQPTTTDVVIRIVGVALTSDELFFNPDQTWDTHT